LEREVERAGLGLDLPFAVVFAAPRSGLLLAERAAFGDAEWLRSDLEYEWTLLLRFSLLPLLLRLLPLLWPLSESPLSSDLPMLGGSLWFRLAFSKLCCNPTEVNPRIQDGNAIVVQFKDSLKRSSRSCQDQR